MTVQVIDAIMGQGKTTFLFQMIKNKPDRRYFYIGLNLAEVDRVKSELADLDFHDPVPVHGAKYWDLWQLVTDGKNIVTTHALFSNMRDDLYSLLAGQGYTLIIDEALAVVDKFNIGKKDLSMLLSTEALIVDDEKFVRWNHEKFPNYKEAHGRLVPLCDNGNLVMTRAGVLIWTFPARFLEAFEEVFIATYLFEGQPMSAHLCASGIDYNLVSVKGGFLLPHAEVDTFALKQEMASRISIENDRALNAVGTKTGKRYPLSSSWFKNRRADHRDVILLKDATSKFFRKIGHGAERNLFTVYKGSIADVKGPRYSHADCFLPLGTKATDDWKHKTALAFLVDYHMDPTLAGYFHERRVELREDLFALNELIQWLWRGAVRTTGGRMEVFVPSSRMRNILYSWIRHTDQDILGGVRLDQEHIDAA